jgi:hypothetical protein
MRGPITIPLVLFALACISIPVLAEGPEQVLSTSTNRKYFPKDWVSGYFDFAVAPPHNEPDLNRCASSSGSSGGASAPCAAFARYVGSGYMEFRPIGTGQFHRAFVFFEPHAYMGRNIPQFQYSDSMAPIAFESEGGIGVSITRNLEFRLTSHRVDWLGKYSNNLGIADLGKNGPLSNYTTVSARWYFGGYRRRDVGY